MFGTNGDRVSNTTASVKSNDIHVQLSAKESGIMASLVSARSLEEVFSFLFSRKKLRHYS